MIYAYQGHFLYSQPVISEWDSDRIGVYYCGYILSNGNLLPLYIGQAVGQDGIRGRLLQHLNQENWPDVTHFGYCVCDTTKEAADFESAEIARLKPGYNVQGKDIGY